MAYPGYVYHPYPKYLAIKHPLCPEGFVIVNDEKEHAHAVEKFSQKSAGVPETAGVEGSGTGKAETAKKERPPATGGVKRGLMFEMED